MDVRGYDDPAPAREYVPDLIEQPLVIADVLNHVEQGDEVKEACIQRPNVVCRVHSQVQVEEAVLSERYRMARIVYADDLCATGVEVVCEVPAATSHVEAPQTSQVTDEGKDIPDSRAMRPRQVPVLHAKEVFKIVEIGTLFGEWL